MKFDRPRFAVIPTRNRPEVLMDCLHSIQSQVDEVIVINNGDDPIRELPHSVIEFRNPMQPVNLSRLWNQGLNLAERRVTSQFGFQGVSSWDVAILNDDAVVPPGWFGRVSHVMHQVGAAAGCSGPVRQPLVRTKAGPVPLHTRMQGWAFILAGELNIRADERLLWWFGDDDLDWKARQQGGMVMVPGFPVEHRSANSNMTPDLHAQTGLDAQTFKEIWGEMPW